MLKALKLFVFKSFWYSSQTTWRFWNAWDKLCAQQRINERSEVSFGWLHVQIQG